MVVVWSATFIYLGWMRHARFSTYGFDLGIYDQGVWLLSQLKDPFVTVRGLELFGHHVNPILVAIAPFYRLGGGPELLLVVQVLAQASGAVAVYLLARDRLGGRWLGVAMAGVLLLNPTYQFLAWEFFHPDALAMAPLLFAYWAARAHRWPWFWVGAVLAMACKEDVALAVLVLGVLIFIRGHRRIGGLAALLATVWYLVATRVVIPAVTGMAPFYEALFPQFGNSGLDAARGAILYPGTTVRVALGEDRLTYLQMMLLPFGMLPFFALPTFFIAAPMLAVNLLNVLSFTRDYRFHYSALVVSAGILATVEAIAWLGHTPRARRALVALTLLVGLGSSVAWGASPISTKFRGAGVWALEDDDAQGVREKALGLIPKGAPVSAAYQFVPHLTHRERIYEFPVPWRPTNWGVDGEGLHDPALVQWVLVDRRALGAEDASIFDQLVVREFEIQFSEAGFTVARRVRPAG